MRGRAAEGEAGRDQDRESQPLDEAGVLLHARRDAHSEDLEKREEERDRDRDRDRVRRREVFADHQRNHRRRTTCTEPVADADDQASVVAERAPRERVLPAGARDHRAQLGDAKGAGSPIETWRSPPQ